MLDISTTLIVAVLGSLWLGFFIERGYKQAATYNLIGKAAKSAVSSKRVESAVNKHFKKWNWLLLSLSFFTITIAVYIVFKHDNLSTTAFVLSAISAVALIKCIVNLMTYYKLSDKEIS